MSNDLAFLYFLLKYTQPSFGYSLSQPQPPTALGPQHQPSGPLGAQQTFNQPSLFVPSTPTQAEFLSASQLGFPQHTHGFGQPAATPAPPPPAQQSTIMVSSATTALMSTNIKAPGPSHAAGPGSAFGVGKFICCYRKLVSDIIVAYIKIHDCL